MRTRLVRVQSRAMAELWSTRLCDCCGDTGGFGNCCKLDCGSVGGADELERGGRLRQAAASTAAARGAWSCSGQSSRYKNPTPATHCEYYRTYRRPPITGLCQMRNPGLSSPSPSNCRTTVDCGPLSFRNATAVYTWCCQSCSFGDNVARMPPGVSYSRLQTDRPASAHLPTCLS